MKVGCEKYERDKTMKEFLNWRFLIHLWTLAGLAFAMLAALCVLRGEIEAAVRWLLLILFVDHTDGTLARAFRIKRHIRRVSGETLDLITDVIGLTFVPMLFCWKAQIFLPGWNAILPVAAAITCSYKYSIKQNVLEEGYSLGAPPVFFSVLLFWLLELPPWLPTVYVAILVVLCWLPVRYPITSLVTTHWKPGFESIINYASFLALVPAMVWLKEGPEILYWLVLSIVLFHLFVSPILMAVNLIRPGFRRVY
jgi:phosphatidylcholine synthase